MSKSNIETVIKGHMEAWVQKDKARAMSYYDEDVVIHVPGRNPTSGTYHGIDGLREFQNKLTALCDAISMDWVESIMFGDDHAAIIVHDRAVRGAQELVFDRLLLFKVKQGSIIEVTIHDYDQYAVDEFLCGV